MLRVLSVQFGCVTIPLTIAHVTASKRKCLVEIFEACLLVPFVASAYVLYLVLLPNMTQDDQIKENIRTQQNNIFAMFIFISSMFLGCDWLPHFLLRVISYWAFAILQIS